LRQDAAEGLGDLGHVLHHGVAHAARGLGDGAVGAAAQLVHLPRLLLNLLGKRARGLRCLLRSDPDALELALRLAEALLDLLEGLAELLARLANLLTCPADGPRLLADLE
jgi:hypothetical protein